jgi:hypothetical protein
VAYWPGDDRIAPRLFFMAGDRLVALNAGTGDPVLSFGESGAANIGIPYISVPLVYEDIVIVGANTPPGESGGIGNPRAYDARTGERLWEFSSVPQPGSPGNDTWEGDSWAGRLGANAWPLLRLPVAPRGDEAVLLQQRKVLRDRRLTRFQQLGQLPDCKLTLDEPAQDHQAFLVGHGRQQIAGSCGLFPHHCDIHLHSGAPLTARSIRATKVMYLYIRIYAITYLHLSGASGIDSHSGSCRP